MFIRIVYPCNGNFKKKVMSRPILPLRRSSSIPQNQPISCTSYSSSSSSPLSHSSSPMFSSPNYVIHPNSLLDIPSLPSCSSTCSPTTLISLNKTLSRSSLNDSITITNDINVNNDNSTTTLEDDESDEIDTEINVNSVHKNTNVTPALTSKDSKNNNNNNNNTLVNTSKLDLQHPIHERTTSKISLYRIDALNHESSHPSTHRLSPIFGKSRTLSLKCLDVSRYYMM